jgi:RNA polymerase sigma-70 factor, ECF subfamily
VRASQYFRPLPFPQLRVYLCDGSERGGAAGGARGQRRDDRRWGRVQTRTGESSSLQERGVPATHAPANQNATFVELYEQTFETVYRYCRLRIADPVEAEDAAALVFANAFAAFPPARPEATRSWLFAIAHNVVANAYRARERSVPNRPLDEAVEVVDPGASPDDLACAGDEIARLRAALDRLSEDQRRVVELRLTGLTGPEIAEAMGRGHAAVKMLQLRAVDRLRALLAPPADAPATREETADERRTG